MHRRETLASWRYLTFSCYKRMRLLGTAPIRDAFTSALRECRERHRFRLIAWVAMPEHVHMIIVPRPVLGYERGLAVLAGLSDVRAILWGLKKPFSQRVVARWKELRAPILERIRLTDGTYRFWQAGGGFDRNIRDESALWQEVRYIHLNPVRRGLADRAEDWRWSSARWYAGDESADVPIDYDRDGHPWAPPQKWIDEAVRVDLRQVI